MIQPPAKVVVTFVDDATGSAFATTELPPADLPETFRVETTLHLGGEDWSVVEARPETRAESAAAGALTLRLRRVQMMNPDAILYSLPSICDSIPACGAEPASDGDCVVIEDDWRQFEFVSKQLESETAAEIAAIRRIHDEQRVTHGWRALHVRRRPDPPISGVLTLAELGRALGGAAPRGVCYARTGPRIASGYSFVAGDGLRCYGTHTGGRVTVLAVGQAANVDLGVSVDALTRVAVDLNLELVRWCRCERATPGEPSFRQMLTGE